MTTTSDALAPTGDAPAIVPRATYRLQFHKDFTFDDALAILPYLQELGISHVYCSPLTRANPGSLHGYDVVAPGEINPELGGRAGFDRFANAVRERGMGVLLDLVPNHMGIGPDNPWWMDVLENGPASAWARFFDIDWQPVDAALAGKVLLPVLGEHFGRVLDDGQLKLVYEAQRGSFALRYWDHSFPVDPRTTAPLLAAAAAQVGQVGQVGQMAQVDDQADKARIALQSLATAFSHLPARERTDPASLTERQRDQGLLRERLATLLRDEPSLQAGLDAALAAFNIPETIADLHEAQAYRLAFWRVASDEINYRRFFDVNELAALRMEDPVVFEAAHGLALDLAAAGLVDGLRIDHPDGLHDPAEYFERLQQGYARRAGLPAPQRDEHGRLARPLYVVVEKIAAGHETVPDTWAVHGSTGYRFANVVNGVLVNTRARERFDRIWRRFSGEADDFAEMAYVGKRSITRTSLASELTVLATELLRIARAHRHSRDYTYNALREALAEVAACMPVYRTYVVDQPSAQDARFIAWAIGQARRRSPLADESVFGFLHQTLLAQAQPGADEALRERVRRFAMRFQQFSSPVAAKGVEDTAFYRYHRLLSLNEVGGEPGTFGLSLKSFHAANADRAARWPHSLIATSTHDNKRSEDVRCRLDVLSEMPSAWRLLLRRVVEAPQLQRVRTSALDENDLGVQDVIPSRADEYLILQTLLGSLPAGGLGDDDLPAYRERIERYVIKCVREAKQHTGWLSPDAAYEEGVLAYVRSLLARVKPNPVLTELQSQADLLAWFGALNSASMTVLKSTAPGVPDIYQGNEAMDLSLVDPDNRRPVDYGLRERLLRELKSVDERARNGQADLPALLASLMATPQDGRLKLWLTWRLLQLRRRLPLLYRDGGYTALPAQGQREEHVVAFARDGSAGQQAVTIVGRLYASLLEGRPDSRTGTPTGSAAWGDTFVETPGWPDGTRLVNALTDESVTVDGGGVRIATVFETLPLAVLIPAVDGGR